MSHNCELKTNLFVNVHVQLYELTHLKDKFRDKKKICETFRMQKSHKDLKRVFTNLENLYIFISFVPKMNMIPY